MDFKGFKCTLFEICLEEVQKRYLFSEEVSNKSQTNPPKNVHPFLKNIKALANSVRSDTYPDANAIAIGHSMGGLALREIAKYDALNSVNTFGGFISAGSPLLGAKILNSIASGSAENAYELICHILPPQECASLGLDAPEGPGRSCQACTFQLRNIPYFIPGQTGRDGLVLNYSQKAEGTPWAITSDKMYEAINVNHMEVRGHTNMTSQLDLCFSRIDFFNTPPW